MTDHPPMTDAELLDLGYKIEQLRDSLPIAYETTAQHYLAEADYATLGAAKLVLDRLYRWTKWPTLAAESGSYLPAPAALAAVPEPPLRCPGCGGPTMDHGDRLSRVCENADCPRVFVKVPGQSIHSVQS